MQAGRRARFRRAASRRLGASGRRFPSLFDGGRELSRAAKHVDARDGVLSDAGSTPAASTTHSLPLVRAVGTASRLRAACLRHAALGTTPAASTTHSLPLVRAVGTASRLRPTTTCPSSRLPYPTRRLPYPTRRG